MNLQETAQLMTIAAAYDGRIVVDQLSIPAWHELLAPFEYEPAKDVVLAHQIGQDRHRVLHVGDIREALDRRAKRTRSQIEADVRSAKARGIIGKDWPAAQELEPDAAERLDRARRADGEHAWANEVTRDWEIAHNIGRTS